MSKAKGLTWGAPYKGVNLNALLEIYALLQRPMSQWDKYEREILKEVTKAYKSAKKLTDREKEKWKQLTGA